MAHSIYHNQCTVAPGQNNSLNSWNVCSGMNIFTYSKNRRGHRKPGEIICGSRLQMPCRGPSSYSFSSTLFRLQCLHWALICSTSSTHLRGLFTHHEVVPCFSKICDWLPLNSSQDHFSLHQENNIRVIMEVEVPKRFISMHALSSVIVQRVL